MSVGFLAYALVILTLMGFVSDAMEYSVSFLLGFGAWTGVLVCRVQYHSRVGKGRADRRVSYALMALTA